MIIIVVDGTIRGEINDDDNDNGNGDGEYDDDYGDNRTIDDDINPSHLSLEAIACKNQFSREKKLIKIIIMYIFLLFLIVKTAFSISLAMRFF